MPPRPRCWPSILGGDAAEYEANLGATEHDGHPRGPRHGETRTKVETAIADGRLPGIRIQDVARVAAATDRRGDVHRPGRPVGDLDARDGWAARTASPTVTGLEDPMLYATTGLPTTPGYHVIMIGGDKAKDGPVDQGSHPLPAPGTKVVYDDASQMVHILGLAPTHPPAAAPPAGWTVYVVEPHGNAAVFADARLRARVHPVAWAADVEADFPSVDRQELLVFDPDGASRRSSRVARLRLADARRHPRGADGGLPVPACADPLPAPARRRARRGVRPRRRDVLRPVAHRHERHLRRLLHHRRLHALRRGLDGLVAGAGGVLGGDAAHRLVARAGAGEQVGRALRDRRDRPAASSCAARSGGSSRSSGSSR